MTHCILVGSGHAPRRSPDDPCGRPSRSRRGARNQSEHSKPHRLREEVLRLGDRPSEFARDDAAYHLPRMQLGDLLSCRSRREGSQVSPSAWTGLCLLLFITGAAYDYAAARWSRCNADDDPIGMAVWAPIVGAIGAVGILGMSKVSPWLALPELAGYSLGSYVAGTLRRRSRC